MPDYQYPGVYIEEIERGPRPIEGVPTATAALLGEAERGSITPRLITSYQEYQRWFGDVFGPNRFLPYAVNGFFENGGTRAFICPLVGKGAATAQASFGDYTVRAAGPGTWGSRVFAKVEQSTARNADGSSVGFRLRLAYWGAPAVPFDPFIADGETMVPRPSVIEDFDDLVVDETSPDFYGTRVGAERSALGVLIRNAGAAAGARPVNGAQALSGGAEDPAALGVDDYQGRPAGGRSVEQGLAALELDPYRDVALVYAPGVSADVAKAVVSHCETLRFRFAVIDSDKGESGTTMDPRNTIADSSYAGFYHPWILVADPRAQAPMLIPPGGHVLGVYARSDAERGAFKAPANEVIRGALGLEYDIDDRLQDDLNPKGVNAVRSFPGRGILVWGARTITSDGLWKYVSVRRFFIFVERSIYEGTQWVVFEPNDDRLWARVTDTIRLFLRQQWRLGALFGRTEEEAFFVSCDRTTMSQDDILNGRLVCEIGLAPVRPAEFVIFRIFQNTADAQRGEPRMDRADPLRNFRFRLEIDGVALAGFSEVAIGDAKIEAPRARKLPGLRKYGNITLKRGLVLGGTALDLFKWHADVAAGLDQIRRRQVVIVMRDEAGADAARLVVTDAWPVKYEPSDLNAKGNEVAIELLELANEGIEEGS